MFYKTHIRALISLVLLADVTACSFSAPETLENPSDKEFRASMMKMNRDMKMSPTGDTDMDFAMMMIPHHQGAVDMARVELEYGTDPELRKLARNIIAAQKREIALMKKWEAQRMQDTSKGQ